MVYSSGYLSVVETAGGVVPDRVMKPSPSRRLCPECGKQLYRSNKSGYCWKCFEKSPHRLEYEKREYCRRKYGGTPESLTRVCGGGCGAILRYANKSGRCHKCYKTLPSTRERSNELDRARWQKVKEEQPDLWQRRLDQYRRSMERCRSTPESRIRLLVRDANAKAQKRGLPYGVTLEDLLPLPSVCPVFGMQLDYSYGGKRGRAAADRATLDRIVPSLGYVASNVCIISWKANELKKDSTPEELQALADYAMRMARKLSIVS